MAPGVVRRRERSSGSCSRPPIIASALVGAAVGGVSGHLWKGMSRADIKEFGDVIDSGEAALVIVGETKIAAYLDKAALRAKKTRDQGARHRQEGRRQGRSGGGEGDLLTRDRPSCAVRCHDRPERPLTDPRDRDGAGDPRIRAQDGGPAPGGIHPPVPGGHRAPSTGCSSIAGGTGRGRTSSNRSTHPSRW